MRRRWSSSTVLKLLLCIFWFFTVALPLIQILLEMTSVDVVDILMAEKFLKALKQSLIVSMTATTISVIIAGVLSWSVARTDVKHKTIINTFLTVPMLIPSISHGMGLIIILGANGWGAKIIGLNSGIYGFWGIVIGSVMYSFPVAYLMLYDVLRYEDGTPYEAADVMGLTTKNKFFAITLPYLRKPLISIVFATFTMIITDYGVPLMIGGKYMTLPVMMYQDVIGMLDFGKGSVIGMILLMPALIACIFDMTNYDKGNSAFVDRPYRIKRNKRRDKIARGIIILTVGVVLLPIMSFAVLAFVEKYPINMSLSLSNMNQTIHMGAMKFLRNSLIIAVVVSVLGTILAILNAYMTARNKTKLSYLLHLASIIPLAIPGLVLGLSYVIFFKGTMIYGTFAILFLVNSMHFFSSPYLMAYNTFSKINDNLEDVGSTMGISKWEIMKDILLPQAKSTIIEMMCYFFVNCMMTISAVSFLANVGDKPIALMITQFEGQMQLECAAFVSLIILIVNVIMKFCVYIIKKKMA